MKLSRFWNHSSSVGKPRNQSGENMLITKYPEMSAADTPNITSGVRKRPWSLDSRGIETTLSVAGTESVTVPAGTFQAYRVEVTGGPTPVTYWVEQAAPHRLLKLQPAGTPLEVVRVK